MYISIIDPIGQPAFKPSRTKPLPKWMSLLPSNVHKKAGQQNICSSTEHSSKPKDLSRITEGSDFNGERSLWIQPSNLEEPKTPGRCSESGGCPSGCSSYSPVEKRGRATTSPQPSQCLPRRDHTYGKRRSQTTRSAYRTAQEYPQTQQPMPPYSSPLPSEIRQETASYFCGAGRHDAYQAKESCCALGQQSPAPDLLELSPIEPAASIELPRSPRTLASTSSEYLEKYQPKTSGTRHKTFVTKNLEPITDKVGRQSLKLKSLDDGSEETRKRKNEAVVKQVDSEIEVGPRREDLKKGLRNLFL